MKSRVLTSSAVCIATALVLGGVFAQRLHLRVQATAATYDLVITNARIVDGSGNPWFRADVAVKDGRIVRIGRVAAAEASKAIDAKGQILAPGFIHT